MRINLVTIMLIALAAVVLIAGCTPVSQNAETTQKNDVMVKDDSAMEDNSMEGETMMEGYSGNVLAGTTTPYIEFNQADYEKALAENKIILLNFYANWCPTCKAEQPEAFEAFDSLNDPNIVGFRVNYRDSNTDSYEKDLAKKFGITYQHTKVIIKDGERILKNPESWNSERYISELNNA